MGTRPNFTDIQVQGTDVVVSGVSDDEETADILDIRVTLVQGDRIDSAGLSLGKPLSSWDVTLPLADEAAEAQDFGPGSVAAFGVETRRKNATITTWAETLTIPGTPPTPDP